MFWLGLIVGILLPMVGFSLFMYSIFEWRTWD